ncbi:MAG: fatty acid desaturase [Pirellulaceae bacterium]
MAEFNFNQMQSVKSRSQAPPPACEYSKLKPSDWLGALYFTGCGSMTGVAIYLSTSNQYAIWLVGQILLSLAMLQWFVLIHEAGHKTLFRRSMLNRLSGHTASLFAGIPFDCWVLVHAAHHRWTGWQDLDATTATLVPRKLRLWERWQSISAGDYGSHCSLSSTDYRIIGTCRDCTVFFRHPIARKSVYRML